MRELGPADEAPLLRLFEECEGWFTAATGLPPGPGDVQSLYHALPEAARPEDKVLLVLERDGVVAGVVDAVRNLPGPGSVAVDLFLPAPRARGRGLGRALAETLLTRAGDVMTVTATVPPGGGPANTSCGGSGSASTPAHRNGLSWPTGGRGRESGAYYGRCCGSESAEPAGPVRRSR